MWQTNLRVCMLRHGCREFRTAEPIGRSFHSLQDAALRLLQEGQSPTGRSLCSLQDVRYAHCSTLIAFAVGCGVGAYCFAERGMGNKYDHKGLIPLCGINPVVMCFRKGFVGK